MKVLKLYKVNSSEQASKKYKEAKMWIARKSSEERVH
jgi:hypothetical protein